MERALFNWNLERLRTDASGLSNGAYPKFSERDIPNRGGSTWRIHPMEKRQIVAISVVAVLVLCGAAYAIASGGDDDQTEPSKGGWYSWNPDTFVCASSNVAPSPYWTNTLSDLYEVVYKEKPDLGKYRLSDVPADYLRFDSLVSHDSEGNLVVEGKYRDSAKVWQSYQVTIDKDRMPTGAIGAGSYFVCVYYILCSAYGVDPNDHDSATVQKLWDLAFGGDSSLFTGLQSNYGIPVDGFKGVELPNPAKVGDNKDLYTKTVENLISQGEVPIWLCSGSSPGWDNGGKWMKEMIEAQGGYAVTFGISTYNDCLAEIEALGYIFGLQDHVGSLIDQLRLEMYALDMESSEAVKRLGHAPTAVAASNKTTYVYADNSGMGMFIAALNMDNIYKGTSGNWDSENIVAAQPEVILFNVSDPSTMDWDEAMRVPTEAV